MAKKRFKAEVRAEGKTGAMASVDVPDAVAEALGGQRVPVKVSVNGFTFRTTTAVMGGRRMIGFNTANRTAANISAGETIDVTVENDTEPRVIDPPPELKKAFTKNKTAKTTWTGLAYTHQREYAEWITSAKKDETRASRAAKAIEMLTAGAKTPR